MHVQSVQKYWFSLSNMQIRGVFIAIVVMVALPTRCWYSQKLKTYYRAQGLDKGKPIYDIFEVLNKYACEFKCLAWFIIHIKPSLNTQTDFAIRTKLIILIIQANFANSLTVPTGPNKMFPLFYYFIYFQLLFQITNW